MYGDYGNNGSESKCNEECKNGTKGCPYTKCDKPRELNPRI
jgi:hypothetical protein